MTKKDFKEIFGREPHEDIPIYSSPNKRKPAKKALSPKKATLPSSMTSKQFTRLTYESMTEAEHQSAFIIWLDLKGIYFEIGLEGIYLPNPHKPGSRSFNTQRASNAKILNKMKAQGMRKGVSDIKVYLPDVLLHIELKKVKGGTQSAEQKRVEKIVNKFSFVEYHLCRGYDEAKEVILALI